MKPNGSKTNHYLVLLQAVIELVCGRENSKAVPKFARASGRYTEVMSSATGTLAYRERATRTQWMTDTMLPIKQIAMKMPINHRNSVEFAIRRIRRPK
jgi:hypothetical protein